MIQIPLLRWGKEYISLDEDLLQPVTGPQPIAAVSRANPGLIRRDLSQAKAAREVFQEFSTAELFNRLKAAGEQFKNGTLPIGEAEQSPSDYVNQLSSTSGLPHTICLTNIQKIHHVLNNMESILEGLTRLVNPLVFDRGHLLDGDQWLSYRSLAYALGILLPSNSPGVNSLWLPSIALKTPVVIKPGRQDPWTPFRIIQALIASGIPREVFCFYPAEHDGGVAILEALEKNLLFGGGATIEPWKNVAGIQIHGPGRSKIIFDDQIAEVWDSYLDFCVSSVLENSGRSCTNASTIILPSNGDDFAQALAERLAKIEPKPLDDPQARLALFPNLATAEAIDRRIQAASTGTSIVDVSEAYRIGDRLVPYQNGAYLQPTVIRCHNLENPLAKTEFLFPFVAIVEMPVEDMLDYLGPTLVLSVVSENNVLIQSLCSSLNIDRINLGPIPTVEVNWNQPHEGNLFHFLYDRRAIQVKQ